MLAVHTYQRLHSSPMHDVFAMELTNKHLENKTLYSDESNTSIPRVLVAEEDTNLDLYTNMQYALHTCLNSQAKIT